jgi:hypothetical protein
MPLVVYENIAWVKVCELENKLMAEFSVCVVSKSYGDGADRESSLGPLGRKFSRKYPGLIAIWNRPISWN